MSNSTPAGTESPHGKLRVLCVDDEPNVLQGLRLHLRHDFEVHLAEGGEQGLELMRTAGPFGIVMSDMRMPGMNGAKFLAKVRELAPDSVRMLLTGFTELETAMQAVNDGQIFRLLTKPCPPELLRASFAAAAEQHRLLSSERVLLQETLHGSVQAMVEVLALVLPEAFGRATRLRRLTGELGAALELSDCWSLEEAAMMSQLGSATIPAPVLHKVLRGETLEFADREFINGSRGVAQRLLGKIPRLEPVLDILAICDAWGGPSSLGNKAPLAAQVLQVALDYDLLTLQRGSADLAIETIRGRSERYEPRVIEAISRVHQASVEARTVEMALRSVQQGMVFATEVRMPSGALLVSRGFEVSPSFLERMKNFDDAMLALRVHVLTPAARGLRSGSVALGLNPAFRRRGTSPHGSRLRSAHS